MKNKSKNNISFVITKEFCSGSLRSKERKKHFLHLFSFKTPIINKIENSLKLFSIIIQNGKSYVENVKISKSR